MGGTSNTKGLSIGGMERQAQYIILQNETHL